MTTNITLNLLVHSDTCIYSQFHSKNVKLTVFNLKFWGLLKSIQC